MFRTPLAKAKLNSGAKSDRFIPNRNSIDADVSLVSLFESANSKAVSVTKSPGKQAHTQHLESLLLSASPARSGSGRLLSCFDTPVVKPKALGILEFGDDETTCKPVTKVTRSIPVAPSRVLDAPDIVDDYYLNLLSWGQNNVLAVALGGCVYLWHASTGQIQHLVSIDEQEIITSVAWGNGDQLAVGTSANDVQLWDASALKMTRSVQRHAARVSSLSWKDAHVVSSGSRDSTILHNDWRTSRIVTSTLVGHTQEVCGLAWSPDGSTLASGGNENSLCIWDAAMSGGNDQHHSPRITIDEHRAAVKALAWCPFQRNVLASGGGTADRTIRIWNAATGANLKTVDTGSQVCALQWSDHYKELLSSHGFSDNQLCLWKYPTMTKIREFRGHTSRALHLAKSPDGVTVVSAGADETLRFWDIFRPCGSGKGNKKVSGVVSGSALSSGLLLR